MSSSILTENIKNNTTTLLAVQKRSDTRAFLFIFAIMCGLTPLLVLSGHAIGYSTVLSCIVVLAAAWLIIRWPITGFYMMCLCVVLVEEEPLWTPILTDQLNIFHWPVALQGLFERPIGFLILFIFLIVVCKNLVNRQRALQGGQLFGLYFFFMLCVVGGVAHGLASGGNLKIIVVEFRPFWYMFVSYLLAYNLVTHKRHLYALLWIIIIGATIKGLQGLYIYLSVLKGILGDHREIMAHEESFFFIAIILLLVLFWLHYRYRPQWYMALLGLPAVIVALVANQRRADYVALLVGLFVAWLLIFIIKPQKRKQLIIGMLICFVLGASYVALFAQSSGAIGAPARALVSVVFPNSNNVSASDANSNMYRVIEDYDLKYTERQNPLFGMGFGKPFLQPYALPDILALDPYYLYVPHNTIYWVWMRLGPIGYFALWFLFGTIIVRGSMIARRLKDPYLQLVAIFVVAITIMEIIVAVADYQLFFYRNVIYLGLLIGVLMKLSTLEEEKEVVAQ